MVILNGKEVSEDQIDPVKHRFIGSFRKPNPPSDNVFCRCGRMLRYVHENLEHWQQGHMDLPQYVDLEGEK